MDKQGEIALMIIQKKVLAHIPTPLKTDFLSTIFGQISVVSYRQNFAIKGYCFPGSSDFLFDPCNDRRTVGSTMFCLAISP